MDLVTHVQFAVPVVAIVLAAGVALIIRSVRSSMPQQKDPQRMFTAAQRLRMFARCGNRCEHKSPRWFRCTSAPSHGDHIYPYSRGGATSLSNGAGLCARHNLAKSNHIPSGFYIRRLERRRRRYFPPGEPVDVVWRIGERP